MRKLLVVAIVFAAVVQGCAPLSEADKTDKADVWANTIQNFDEHKGGWKTTGPTIYPMTINDSFYLLRANHADVVATDDEQVQLYFGISLTDWWFVDRAFSHGERLELKVISRDVSACSSGICFLREHVAIVMSGKEFREIISRGDFQGKIVGKKGEAPFNIPRSYLAGFASKLYGVAIE